MITLFIYNSLNPDIEGEWVFFKNRILIHPNQGDILTHLHTESASFELNLLDEQYVLCSPQGENFTWKVDHKKATQKKHIKTGQIIETSDFCFKIVSHSLTNRLPIKEAPPKEILQFLEKLKNA
jgi:hypothetical protein